MHKALQPLVFAAVLAAGCSTPNEKPAPAAKPAPKPADEHVAAMPAMPILPAGDKPAPKPDAPAATAGDSREERCSALQAEYSAAQQSYYAAFREALAGKESPTREELEKIRSELKEPDTQAYVARAQALVDEDATDLAAFHALGWLLDNQGAPDQQAPTLALLEKHHMQRIEMGELCSRFAQNARPMLEKLVANSPHVEVRGQACYALAEGLKQDIETADYVKKAEPSELEGMKGYLGADKFAALQTLDVEQAQKELEQTYERVVKDFGDVKVDAGTKHETTLGKRAGAALHEIRDLTVGKTTPEIEGVDLDSVAFKLSDYRGKVVLLDFWGNW
jgi:hypothetical protein